MDPDSAKSAPRVLLRHPALVVEAVFAWPGLGRLMFESIQQRDYPLIQAIVLVFALLMLLVNLIVDVLYVAIDPRVRYG